MTSVSDNRLLDDEFYIEVAKGHGEDSEYDHEVGDLQEFFRAAWSLLSPEQKVAFAKSAEVHRTLNGAGAEYDEDLQALLKRRAKHAPGPPRRCAGRQRKG